MSEADAYPQPTWEDRKIRFTWWHKPDILALHIGGAVSFSDLYVEEVQALVDDLTWESMGVYAEPPTYRRPVRTRPYRGGWYDAPGPCRPGRTIFADYGPSGDMWDVVCRGATCWLSKTEAEALVRAFRRVTAEVREEKPRWQRVGF